MKIERPLVVVAAALSCVALLVPGVASAQDKPAKMQQGVLQVGEITIVGRVQKPIAAVDVAKIQAKLTLAELRQPFLDRIEEAVKKDPF
jgi:hypothetical protein